MILRGFLIDLTRNDQTISQSSSREPVLGFARVSLKRRLGLLAYYLYAMV